MLQRGEDMEKDEEDMIVKDEDESKPIVADTVYMLSLMARFKIKGPIFPYPEDVELETGA